MTLDMNAMIFAEPAVVTAADLVGLSDNDLWRALARQGDRQEAAAREGDDEEYFAATRSVDIIRKVMEEKNLLSWRRVRAA